ncbi:MAG: hypothetical protein CM1200mP4_1110 [Rhodospirillaceae bacterium]|nr:MAG: hypothetical protein CM1200mP4_1110 [Rhodospirillaceae bacterium]
MTMWYAILLFGEAGAEIMYPNPGFPIFDRLFKFFWSKSSPYSADRAKKFCL